MLKSTAPVQEEEEDPLAYYEKHTSQIEARPVSCGAASAHVAAESRVCSSCLVPGDGALRAFPSLCRREADGLFALQSAGGVSRAHGELGERAAPRPFLPLPGAAGMRPFWPPHPGLPARSSLGMDQQGFMCSQLSPSTAFAGWICSVMVEWPVMFGSRWSGREEGKAQPGLGKRKPKAGRGRI